jgi:type I restriction enzyme S subunit
MSAVQQLLTEHLDIWSAAETEQKSGRGRSSANGSSVYGIRKLRKLILELAVRGKLVPQDASDEPASELLKRIQAEKARLIAEGKIRKDKPLAKLKPDEAPYQLPDGWEWVRFGDIAEHNSGKTLDNGRNTGTLHDYITTSNLYWGKFELANVRQMLIRDEELEKCTARKDDLLICEGGEAGRAAVWSYDNDICFQNHVHRARFYCDIDPYYAFRFFEKLDATGEINEYRKGVGISNMSGKALASIVLPLPPFAEQHRVVAKVDELMALCDQLETRHSSAADTHEKLVRQLLATLTQSSSAADFAANWQRIAAHFDTLFCTEASIDALKQTLLQLAVMGKLVPQDPHDEPAGELLKQIQAEKARLIAEGKIKKEKSFAAITEQEKPFQVPNGWEWCRAEYISAIIVDCPHSTPKFVGSGMLCVDTNSIKQGRLVAHKIRYVDSETFFDRNRRLTPKTGDIVFAREGSVGESFVIPEGMECCLGQRVMLFRPSNRINPEYFRLSLSEPGSLNRILELHKGIGAKHVNVADMRAALVSLPPFLEQNFIVAKIDQLMALCDQLKARIAEATHLQQKLADVLVEQAVA